MPFSMSPYTVKVDRATNRVRLGQIGRAHRFRRLMISPLPKQGQVKEGSSGPTGLGPYTKMALEATQPDTSPSPESLLSPIYDAFSPFVSSMLFHLGSGEHLTTLG